MILSRDHGAVADVAKGNQDWMYTVVNPGQPMVKPFLHDIEELLWPKGFTRDMWMIVDGARDPRAQTASGVGGNCAPVGTRPGTPDSEHHA